MTNTVIAHMRTCSKTNKVTVWMKDDGSLGVRIVSDCKNVQDYAKRLTELTMGDITNFNGSRIVAPEMRCAMSAPCLTPNAVFEAAWLETGMLSKNLVKKVGFNSLTFHPDAELEEVKGTDHDN